MGFGKLKAGSGCKGAAGAADWVNTREEFCAGRAADILIALTRCRPTQPRATQSRPSRQRQRDIRRLSKCALTRNGRALQGPSKTEAKNFHMAVLLTAKP